MRRITSSLRGLPVGIALALVLSNAVAAHNPTGADNEYADNFTQQWYFGAGNPGSWFQTAVRAALGANWNGDDTTKAPTWQEGTSGTEVRYQTNAQTPNTTECPSTFWYMCSDYSQPGSVSWAYVVVNSQQNSGGTLPWYWCQDPNQPSTSCIDVQRSMLHEAGHGAGLARSSNGDSHQPQTYSSAWTVMQLNPIRNASAGWDDHFLGTCDIMGLQLVYDVSSLTDGYGCADHIPGQQNAGGPFSVVSSSATAFDGCAGTAVTTSGRAALKTTTDYGRLSNNSLAGRTVRFDRKVHGTTTWTTNYTSTTATSATGSNWTKAFTTTSSTTITYDIRAHFDGESNVDSDTSPTFTITFYGPAC